MKTTDNKKTWQAPALACLLALAYIGIHLGLALAGERQVTERLAAKYRAEVEVVLPDRTRCDLVSETEAIEVDWARKWPEAIGQSLYYGLVLEKQPAIVLLQKTPKDQRHIDRCRKVCDRYKIHLYVEAAE